MTPERSSREVLDWLIEEAAQEVATCNRATAVGDLNRFGSNRRNLRAILSKLDDALTMVVDARALELSVTRLPEDEYLALLEVAGAARTRRGSFDRMGDEVLVNALDHLDHAQGGKP